MFFVISGFIMVYVSRNFSGPGGAADFAIRRVIRVVPLYWLFTGVFVALLLFWPSIFSTLKLSARHTAESFLFIPTVNNVGDYYPVLGVGWTLNYEMYFYAIFAVLLLVPISRSVMITAVFFLACVIYGYINPPDGPDSLHADQPDPARIRAGRIHRTVVHQRPAAQSARGDDRRRHRISSALHAICFSARSVRAGLSTPEFRRRSCCSALYIWSVARSYRSRAG